MDLAKSEQKKFKLNNQFFDLTKIIDLAFENMAFLGIEKEI